MSQLIAKIPHWSERITESQKIMLDEHYSIIANTRDMDYFLDYLENRNRWRYPMVSFDTFLDDPRYLGSSLLSEEGGVVKSNIYPKVRRIGKEILEGNYTEAVIVVGIGGGKCLVLGTEVLMYSGEIKKVEDIVEGDKVMGDDGTPRNVSGLSRGIDEMFEVVPVKGKSFVVNSNHILSFKRTNKGVISRSGSRDKKAGEIVNIKVTDWFRLSKKMKGILKIWRSKGMSFNKKKYSIAPYYLGLWLGDGSSRDASVTVGDKEQPIIDYLYQYCSRIGGHKITVIEEKGNCKSFRIRKEIDRNPNSDCLRKRLRELNLLLNKHVPLMYKANDKETRIQLLSGYLDADGCLHHNGYDYISKSKILAEDIAYVARSLGLACYVKECTKSCQNGGGGIYYRGSISGDTDMLKCRLVRKVPKKRQQKKNVLYTGVKEIRSVGKGEYAGFSLDGNHLFLLGDFTVTHNTLASNLLSCYMAHKLLCYRDPHKEFNLVKDKPITLMNMGTTATQALEVAFSGIKAYMQVSPWFQRFNPHILGGSVRFLENNILIVAGNSKSTTPLGYNIFNATLDEAAFYLDNDNVQLAEEIYMALQRRITSRFPGKGLLVMISSPLYEGDFVMRQLEVARKMPDLIYSAQLPTWKAKPITDKIRKNTFYFNARKSLILDTKPTTFGSICKLDDDFDSKKEIWEIPTDYKKAFMQDPDKAKRDFAAVPSKAVQAFMPHWEIIEKMFTDEESPLQTNGSYIFPEAPLRCNYYIHIDLALNKEGKGDYAGLSMCHFGGWEENPITKERHKTVVVDLAERIGAGNTGEIAFSDVRNKVYALKAMGYNIKLVTTDSYQSEDLRQLLRSKGLRSELLSVDRTIEPYQTLKEMIYSERIKCHKMPELLEEFSRLEITKANKIDHAPGSKKDISDSVAGCTFSCVQDTGGEVGIASASYFPRETGHPVPGEKSDREKYYERLEELNKKGLLN